MIAVNSIDALPLLVSHMIGDFVLQTDWIAENKRRNPRALLIHVALYTLSFVPIIVLTCLGGLEWQIGLLILLTIAVTHYTIDSSKLDLGSKWVPKALAVDQTLHLVVLAFIQFWLNRGLQ